MNSDGQIVQLGDSQGLGEMEEVFGHVEAIMEQEAQMKAQLSPLRRTSTRTHITYQRQPWQ